jgi:hypothetical protein
MRYKVGKWGWPISGDIVPGNWLINTDLPVDRMDRWSREIYQRGLQPPPDTIPIEETV